METKIGLYISIDKETKKRFKEIAKKEYKTMSALIVQFIDNKIENSQKNENTNQSKRNL